MPYFFPHLKVSEELNSVETSHLDTIREVKEEVSEELNSVETIFTVVLTLFKHTFQKNLIVWKLDRRTCTVPVCHTFQKNLIVWKLSVAKQLRQIIGLVSEELNSVETHILRVS